MTKISGCKYLIHLFTDARNKLDINYTFSLLCLLCTFDWVHPKFQHLQSFQGFLRFSGSEIEPLLTDPLYNQTWQIENVQNWIYSIAVHLRNFRFDKLLSFTKWEMSLVVIQQLLPVWRWIRPWACPVNTRN